MMTTTQRLSSGMLALTIGVMGFSAGLHVDSADAATSENLERPAKMENVTRDINYLDNGVQIDISSTDAEEVAKIQERAENKPAPKHEDVSMSYELTDDGVIITITSDNAEAVEKIQEHAENGPKKVRGEKKHGEHPDHCEREDDEEDAI